MKIREISAIGKQLMYTLPDFILKGPLIFKIKSEGIMLGLHFDGQSRDGATFRVNAIVLPLFVPTDIIHLNYSQRIPKIGWWNKDDQNLIDRLTECIRVEAIPFLNAVSTLQGVAEFIRPMVVPNVDGYVNPHCQEALAYTLIKLNDFNGALTILNQAKKALSMATYPWELAMRARMQLIEEKLLSNPEAALAQLEAWKSETVSKLGLEK